MYFRAPHSRVTSGESGAPISAQASLDCRAYGDSLPANHKTNRIRLQHTDRDAVVTWCTRALEALSKTVRPSSHLAQRIPDYGRRRRNSLHNTSDKLWPAPAGHQLHRSVSPRRPSPRIWAVRSTGCQCLPTTARDLQQRLNGLNAVTIAREHSQQGLATNRTPQTSQPRRNTQKVATDRR